MNEYKYLYLSNLPKYCTKFEIINTFTPKLTFNIINIFQYKISNSFLDFNCCLCELDLPLSLNEVLNYQKNQYYVSNKLINVVFTFRINSFFNSYLFVNNSFKNLVNIINYYFLIDITLNLKKIPHPFINIYTYTFSESINHLEILNKIPNLEFYPIINKKSLEYQYNLINLNKENILNFSNFKLIYNDNIYLINKILSNELSNKIKECLNDFIILPFINGPIEDIINYLYYQKIFITFEKIPFLLKISEFLEINKLINELINFINLDLNIYNISSYCILFEQYDYIHSIFINFIIKNFNEIENNLNYLNDLPYNYYLNILKKLDENNLNSKKFIEIIQSLNKQKKIF